MITISSAEVHKLLSMPKCIDLMNTAFKCFAEGKVEQPLRTIIPLPPSKQNIFCTMPCAVTLDDKTIFGAKILSVFSGNHGTQYDSHSGVIILFESQHGQPAAIIEAGAVTKIRTAAASALATKYLAISDEERPLVCGILGAGVQADSHIEAMLAVRKLSKILIWNRNHGKAQALAKTATEKYKVQVEALESAKEVVSQSDIICTVTASTVPVVQSEWVKPGTHINAVGSCEQTTREIDSETVKRALVYSDSKVSLFGEGGDFLIPLREGAFGEDHFKGGLADLVSGKAKGRTSPQDVTLFKSLGLAMEDIVCANELYQQAKAQKQGQILRDK